MSHNRVSGLVSQGLSEQPPSVPHPLRRPAGSAVCERAGLQRRSLLLEWNGRRQKVCGTKGF